jgi:hypothetical protein
MLLKNSTHQLIKFGYHKLFQVHTVRLMPKKLIKRLQKKFKRPNNTFKHPSFIYLGTQLILPRFFRPSLKCVAPGNIPMQNWVISVV